MTRGTQIANGQSVVSVRFDAPCLAGREADRVFRSFGGIKVTFRVTLRPATILVAFLALLLGIPVAASPASAATGTGWIKLGNLSSSTSPVDVYVYPSGSSSPKLVQHGVSYGTVSPAQVVAAGAYSVKMRAAGSAATSKPVLATSLMVQPDHSYTVAALTSSSGKQLKVIDDSLTTPTGKSLVRVIQASQQKQVTFHCSCAPGAKGNVTSNAAPGSVSGYAPIPPGNWTMTATGPSAKASTPVALTASTVHTEIVLDAPGGIEIMNTLDAAGAGQPPSGGVSTGFGGAAQHSPGSALPWLAVIGTGALLTLAGGLRLRRKEPRRVTTRM